MSKRDTYDVVVVGGGPAGMAAAAAAASSGNAVLLIDDNPGLGGQIWRGEEKNPATQAAAYWYCEVQRRGVEVLRGAGVFDVPATGVLLAESSTRLEQIGYSRLVLATGAREGFLPFAGWTLPNVMGAGGLQAMVKSGMPIDGKRVVIAGSGPLLLAAAEYLRAHGANVLAIAEQASKPRLARFAASLLRFPSKVVQAAQLRRKLAGIPYLTSTWPVRCEGQEKLETVTLETRGRQWALQCDYLGCGFHLVPNTELAALLGCRLRNNCVAVDEFQSTSVLHVYCAGEPTGIGGMELSVVEGQIAGYAAAGAHDRARRLFGRRARARAFALALERTFALRPELRQVAESTILCRCEDVTIAQVRGLESWREAKLYTRCGMGPCQGRVCGAAASFLFGWSLDGLRPPVFPAQVAHLAAAPADRDPR